MVFYDNAWQLTWSLWLVESWSQWAGQGGKVKFYIFHRQVMSNLTGVIIKHPDNGIKSHVEQCDTISSLEIINSDLFNSQWKLEINLWKKSMILLSITLHCIHQARLTNFGESSHQWGKFYWGIMKGTGSLVTIPWLRLTKSQTFDVSLYHCIWYQVYVSSHKSSSKHKPSNLNLTGITSIAS